MPKPLQQIVIERLAELGIDSFEAERRGGLKRSFVYEITIGKKSSVYTSNLAKLAKALDWDSEHLERLLRAKRADFISSADEDRLRKLLRQAFALRAYDPEQMTDWTISALKDLELSVDDPDALLKHIGRQSVVQPERRKATEDKPRHRR